MFIWAVVGGEEAPACGCSPTVDSADASRVFFHRLCLLFMKNR